MTRTLTAAVVLLLAGCAGGPDLGEAPPARAAEPVYFTLRTTAGDILLELDPVRAPISTANFLRYVEDDAYDGTVFHRVVPGFVVQGGGYTPDLTELPSRAPIRNEWGNGLRNVRGTIGMARDTDPDSATRQFYINLADNDRLDLPRDVAGRAGYAVFGRVAAGMDVVDAIAQAETYDPPDSELEDVPLDPPVLLDAERITPREALRATGG